MKPGKTTSAPTPISPGQKRLPPLALTVMQVWPTLSRRTRGSIGYVEYAFAKQNNLSHTQLASAEGKFLQPTMETFQAAAMNADWKNAPGFRLLLNNQPGADSWPMTAATFILMHKDQADAGKAREILKFFDWSYENGNELAEALDFIPHARQRH